MASRSLRDRSSPIPISSPYRSTGVPGAPRRTLHARLLLASVQADLDADKAHPSIEALPDFGLARRAHRIAGGAIELGIPEQGVVADGADWKLEWRRHVPVDGANAEVSLLTGSVAAQMMLKARIGVLRTLPEPSRHDVQDFLERARAHGVRGESDLDTWIHRIALNAAIDLMRRRKPRVDDELAADDQAFLVRERDRLAGERASGNDEMLVARLGLDFGAERFQRRCAGVLDPESFGSRSSVDPRRRFSRLEG